MFSNSSNLVFTGGTFIHVDNSEKPAGGFELLQQTASSSAFHNSRDRRDPPKCHPNTRVAIQKKIMDWILKFDQETRHALIMWLHGPAGSGKSAIAQTIAELCQEESTILASFFFSRFDSTRNHERSLVATVAYQAASHFPSARKMIGATVESDPLIFSRSLSTQVLELIVKPLHHLAADGCFDSSKSRRLVVIDGLDECIDRSAQVDILRTIANAMRREHLPVIFLIASRPEHDITHTFGLELLKDITTRLPLDANYQSSLDIELYLREKFMDIKETHPFKDDIPKDWPNDEIMAILKNKASGQFIYGSTVVKHVESLRHAPVDRLNVILGLSPSASRREMPFNELDALYHHIFSGVDDIEMVLRILAFDILSATSEYSKLLSIKIPDLEEILGLRAGQLRVILCDLPSLIDMSYDELRLHHASLEDFLLDESRSKALHIDAPLRHSEFAISMIQYFMGKPKTSSLSNDVVRMLEKHIKLASPSAELHQALLKLDIIHLLPMKLVRESHGMQIILPELLQSIKRSQLQDSQELYIHHAQRFTEHVGQKLGTYFSNLELTTLIALVVCHGEISVPLPYTQGGREVIPDVQDTSGLMITTAWAKLVHYDRRYWKFLQECLIRLTEKGQYALDGEKYSRAALYLLSRMYDPTTQKYLLYDGLYFLGRLLDRAGHLKALIDNITEHQSFISREAQHFKKRSTTAGYFSMNLVSKSQEDYKRIMLVEIAQGMERYMKRMTELETTKSRTLKRKRGKT